MDEELRPFFHMSSQEVYAAAMKSASLDVLYQAILELLERKPTVRNQMLVVTCLGIIVA